MKKKTLKKVVLGTIASVLFLFIVLCIHIYVVMKPKAPDAHTIAMARIDFKQNITTADAAAISGWLYQQKGIAHVLCNPATKIAVFTFYPVKTNADEIVNRLTSNLHLSAKRFVPSAKDMASGCPVASTSFTYKIYDFMSKIL
jgi:hypothetical protein